MSDYAPTITRQSVTRKTFVWCLLTFVTLLLAALCLFGGSVDIPVEATWDALTGRDCGNSAWTNIVLELRVPMTITAAFTGAALGLSGLLLQTTFNNPLAGPSILGVSTGASFGVACVMLLFPGLLSPDVSAITGAVAGSFVILALLLGLSTVVRSTMMLLIVGILISYLTSSAIAILNFYATQEGVHSYVIWGLGDFSGVGRSSVCLYASLIALLFVASIFMVKPLNALLMGERYASGVGTDVRMARTLSLLVSGCLIAICTAFCGPIGFLGLAVPHIARLSFRTSNHKTLIPAVILTGAMTGLLTLWISALPQKGGVIPVNAITPVIGVPVVLYIIINRRKIAYFN